MRTWPLKIISLVLLILTTTYCQGVTETTGRTTTGTYYLNNFHNVEGSGVFELANALPSSFFEIHIKENGNVEGSGLLVIVYRAGNSQNGQVSIRTFWGFPIPNEPIYIARERPFSGQYTVSGDSLQFILAGSEQSTWLATHKKNGVTQPTIWQFEKDTECFSWTDKRNGEVVTYIQFCKNYGLRRPTL